ncbi:dihydrolipoyl dehydrogenase family protein [Dyadobacter tibetensis]|uniref:dihydrolipoyl dehydrogenase family protein n=1 Tax=Dyadobacter tibetensis TaxID=1211851 RepID=UPI0004700E8C|nr:FAD-dependent oxidoreductase [Dyadobacter tibetensis]
MESSKYDIIVIGAGSGGLGVSLFMAKVGLKVLLVDKSDKHIGGDCLNYGCVPSKALIHASRLVHQAQAGIAFGIYADGKPDLEKVMHYIYEKQEHIRKHENADYLRREGIDVVLGMAKFVDKDAITVRGIVYKARRIILATGSRPTKLSVPGVERVNCIDNEHLFTASELAGRMLVVGGGPIGVEMGQAMNRLGLQVTIVQSGPQLLAKEEPEIVEILHKRLIDEGMDIRLNTEVKSFEGPYEANLVNRQGKTCRINFDSVFVAAGRHFELENLDLDRAGIEVQNGKIIVNRYLQTSNNRIFTCGDIAGFMQFSHAAEQHTRLLLNNLFSPLKRKLNNDHMSWVTFSDPEVATFGLQLSELKKRKIKYQRLEISFEDDDRAVVDDYQYGKLILYLSPGGLLRKQRILGGTMIAPQAGELVQELLLANSLKLDIDAIFNKIYPYPVASRVNQMIIVNEKEKMLKGKLNGVLRGLFRFLNR